MQMVPVSLGLSLVHCSQKYIQQTLDHFNIKIPLPLFFFIYLPIYQFYRLCMYLFICSTIYICLFIYLLIYLDLSLDLSISSSLHFFISSFLYLFMFSSLHLFFSLFLALFISIYLFIYLALYQTRGNNLCFDLNCTLSSISKSSLDSLACNLHNRAYYFKTIKSRVATPHFNQNYILLSVF